MCGSEGSLANQKSEIVKSKAFEMLFFCGVPYANSLSFTFAAVDLRSEILTKTADEVSTTLRLQLQTLDDAKKISKSMPGLLEGTEKTLKAVLNSVSSLSRVETDVQGIKAGVQTLLGMTTSFHYVLTSSVS